MTALATVSMVRIAASRRGPEHVSMIHVACPTHARAVVSRSEAGTRFHVSAIDETERRCDFCASGTLDDFPIDGQ